MYTFAPITKLDWFAVMTDETEGVLLWKKFAGGDSQALGELMTRYFRDLFHYGSRFSREPEFVKDCIQDLFVYLWEHRQSINTNIPVKPYLMAALRRRMHRRSAAQDPFAVQPESLVDDFELVFSVEEEYITSEASRQLVQKVSHALECLPRRQKEVIFLRYFQELDRQQIAEVMGISPQTASNLMQLAIKQLRTHWKEELMLFFLLFH